MASASSFPGEDQLLCSICLDIFTEPVSTPCGHNYCKTCIIGYWSTSDRAECPLCKKKFYKRPQLQVNTGFRDMVAHFNQMRVKGEIDSPVQPGEVPCDVCIEPKLKAQKTCVVCLASYCQPHLEPHQRVAAFKKHQLIDPVSNLEDRVCKKHDKMFELFCQVDQTCVCYMCLKEDHAMHDVVSLEQVYNEKKAELVTKTSELKMVENEMSENIKEIKSSLENRKKESQKEIVDITVVFTALVVSLQRSQTELVGLILEKQQEAEKQAEALLAQLEQEFAELGRRRSEMEQLLQAEDHQRILQSFLSHSGDPLDSLSHVTPPFSKQDLPDVDRQSYVGVIQKAVAQMEKTLNNEMEMLIHEVRFSDGCEAAARPDDAEKTMTDEFIDEVWIAPEDKLTTIQQCHAVDVTLDPLTAHTKLLISDNGKELRQPSGWMFWPFESDRRFCYLPYVLAKDGFSSGRFYYEVRVSGSKNFVLGVAKESVNKDITFTPTPDFGAWTLIKTKNYYQESYFTHGDTVSLNLLQSPQRVGVFVDFEKGEVSFYDVDARTLIFSYTQCNFKETQPARKSLLLAVADLLLKPKLKLYPILGVLEDGDQLVITPVAGAT